VTARRGVTVTVTVTRAFSTSRMPKRPRATMEEHVVAAVHAIRQRQSDGYSEVQVEWSDGSRSWEPFENVKDCAQFHDYLSTLQSGAAATAAATVDGGGGSSASATSRRLRPREAAATAAAAAKTAAGHAATPGGMQDGEQGEGEEDEGAEDSEVGEPDEDDGEEDDGEEDEGADGARRHGNTASHDWRASVSFGGSLLGRGQGGEAGWRGGPLFGGAGRGGGREVWVP